MNLATTIKRRECFIKETTSIYVHKYDGNQKVCVFFLFIWLRILLNRTHGWSFIVFYLIYVHTVYLFYYLNVVEYLNIGIAMKSVFLDFFYCSYENIITFIIKKKFRLE